MGSGRLMGFIDNVAPAAIEMNPEVTTEGEEIACDPSHPTSIFVFKTIIEPFLGKITYFKVISGVLKVGQDLINNQNDTTERFNQLFIMDGKNKNSVDQLVAGDIGATVKLKNTHTNQTLHEKSVSYAIEPMEFPAPRITSAIRAKDKNDDEKLAEALREIHEEDPTILYGYSKELKQLILNGQGELHFAVTEWKLSHLHKIEIEYLKPRIAYRETIQKAADADYRHKKQSGGAGQFGEVFIRIEPYYDGMPDPTDFNIRGKEVIELDWGGKLVFYNCIVGGVIDARYIPSILKGIMEKWRLAPLLDLMCAISG